MRIVLLLPAILALAACRKPVPPEDAILPTDVAPAEAPRKEAPLTPPPAAPDSLSRVHFAYDSAAVGGAEAATLERNARVLDAHPDARVEVQGHCDDRGTTDYNLALGQRRADTVRRYLLGQGVAPSAVSAISYGEERPLDAGEDESAWAANRRAELRVSGDASVTGTVP